MEKLIFLFLSLMFLLSCSDNEKYDYDNNNQSNFSITVTCSNTAISNVSVYLFNSENTTFSEIQEINRLQKDIATDINGNEHHSFYSFKSDNGFIKHPLLAGNYALYVVVDKTGRYTFKNLKIEEEGIYSLEKEFSSLEPSNSYEEWD